MSQASTMRALIAPTGSELRRGTQALGAGIYGQLAGLGLLASSAWLITTASLRPPVLTLSVAIGTVQVFALSRGVARYGARLAGHDLALRVLARVRVWAYARLEPLIPGPATGTRGGDLLARFVSDVDAILDLYVRAVLPAITAVIGALIAVAVAGLLDPPAGAVLAGGVLLGAGVVPVVSARVARGAGTRLADLRGARDGDLVDALRGASEIVAFGAEAAILDRVAARDRALSRLGRRVALASAIGAATSTGLGGLLAAGTTAAAVPALNHGAIGGATVAVLAFLGLGVGETIAGLPEAAAHLAESLAGARRVVALAGTAPAVLAPAESILGSVGRPSGPPAVRLEAVTLRWPGSTRPALDGLDLLIPPGAHLAVTGPSGAGKSTLGQVLLRFAVPDAGSVTLDGVDLARFDPESVRALVGWAPQDPHIFGTSLAANLRLARPDASDEALWVELDRVGLRGWASGLPDGLDTILGERGATVSGGEAQRIGVARALLADRPVLLLDEPTAHLDEGLAADLEGAVLGAAQGRTVIWITHRHSGLGVFDQVAVLVDGRRTDPGAPA